MTGLSITVAQFSIIDCLAFWDELALRVWKIDQWVGQKKVLANGYLRVASVMPECLPHESCQLRALAERLIFTVEKITSHL